MRLALHCKIKLKCVMHAVFCYCELCVWSLLQQHGQTHVQALLQPEYLCSGKAFTGTAQAADIPTHQRRSGNPRKEAQRRACVQRTIRSHLKGSLLWSRYPSVNACVFLFACLTWFPHLSFFNLHWQRQRTLMSFFLNVLLICFYLGSSHWQTASVWPE